ncbi:MAG: hypothetical protein MI725_15670 [Pirellulales bacterium]|nr:hypothetical protein [Pirellulales bacterium]
MSLRDDFLQELQTIVGQKNQRVSVSAGPRTLRCEVDQCDPLAVAVFELILETSELANVEIAKLQAASQSLCNRVTYLLEPISPIETDADGCIVQMRSSPPQQQENGRYYYELLLKRGGCVAMYRYEKQPGAVRSRVAATLTQEVLGRLVEDFDTTVAEVLRS